MMIEKGSANRYRWFKTKLSCLIIAACVEGSTALAGEPTLKPGERIVFLGDSITQAGAQPGGYVALMREALEQDYAELNCEVIGAGVSGNRVPNLEARLERDVLSKKPTLVVIYIGINDVWHSQNGRGTSQEDFEQGLKRIIQQIQDAGARVVLATPSVIGEKHNGGNPLDGMLEEYSAISRQVAKQTGSQLLDLRKLFLSYLQRHNPDQKEKGVLSSDGVHLNPAGNKFVAAAMLAALTGQEQSEKLLRHVVLFQFKSEVTPEQVAEVVDAFAALPGKIDTIVAFEHGVDVSVEQKAQGFTHAFVVTFQDAAGRDTYLPHPAHQEFVKLVGPRLANVLVFDYFAK